MLPPPPAITPRRLLIVDDNIEAAETLTMLLRMMGHEVLSAHSGQAALERAAELCPEVVLLDIGMPDMNGYEVARRLRALPGMDHPLLVALTGWGAAEDRRRAEEAGFDLHLTKPADLGVLEEILRRPLKPSPEQSR
jgi:CheY-like chemotaxis protein